MINIEYMPYNTESDKLSPETVKFLESNKDFNSEFLDNIE